MNMLWSPSQTPAVKDICEHLSPRERRTATGLAALFGLWIAGCLNLIVFLILFQRSSILGAVVPFLVVGFVLGGSGLLKKQKTFLLNTPYAKDKGYTRDHI